MIQKRIGTTCENVFLCTTQTQLASFQQYLGYSVLLCSLSWIYILNLKYDSIRLSCWHFVHFSTNNQTMYLLCSCLVIRSGPGDAREICLLWVWYISVVFMGRVWLWVNVYPTSQHSNDILQAWLSLPLTGWAHHLFACRPLIGHTVNRLRTWNSC